jgi:type II secretory pathway pseudopilin PulG
MRFHASSRSGLTLVELSVTTGLVGVLGLIIYTLLNMGTVLGARNTATNTAHQQARIAMIEMIQDLHAAVSLPQLVGVVGSQASEIDFQQWGSVVQNGVVTNNGGPHEIKNDAAAGQKVIVIKVTSGQPSPIVGQRVIVPTHQIESDIDAVALGGGNYTITLHDNLPVAINGTVSGSGDIVCYITDRCSYKVVEVLDELGNSRVPAEYKLQWTKRSAPPARDIVNDITNPRPFSIPTTPAGALYYRFVAAVDLSTSDPKYSKRGYKSANILLNGQVPFKARLTTYQ